MTNWIALVVVFMMLVGQTGMANPAATGSGQAAAGIEAENRESEPAASYAMESDTATVSTRKTQIGEQYVSGDYEYVILPDGTAEISFYRGKAEELVIPDNLDGIPVTGIGDKVFLMCGSLTSVKLPDGVTSIGSFAFSLCRSLKTVSIPDSVTEIGISAFSECRSLECVEIPDSVTEIGISAFSGCRSLECVEIPDGVTGISDGLFKNCDMLTRVILPEGITSIGEMRSIAAIPWLRLIFRTA